MANLLLVSRRQRVLACPTAATVETPLERECEWQRDGLGIECVAESCQSGAVTGRSCDAGSAVYHPGMSYRLLRESVPSPSSGTEQDVEPYFEEPLVELDLDTLE